MADEDNVTAWIGRLQEGDEDAAQALFERYYDRLVQLARHNLRGARRREADEEDVAAQALGSFFHRARDGQFGNLAHRDDLWSLLVTITVRKAAAQRRRERAVKRQPQQGVERGESIFGDQENAAQAGGLDRREADIPAPELLAMVKENWQRLVRELDDPLLRQIAAYKLEGLTHKEIAERIGRVEETVNRKVKRIREKWSRVLDADEAANQPTPRGGDSTSGLSEKRP